MTEKTDSETEVKSSSPNISLSPDGEKTEEKKEKPTTDLDDSDNGNARYDFTPITILDFKKTPKRNQELHRFRDVLNAPFINVPMLVVECQEDALPVLSLYAREHSQSGQKSSFFSVTPSDFGLDFQDSDYSFDLRKNLNLGGTIIEEGDLKNRIPVYCDLIDYDDREVLGTFIGNFLKKNMPAVLLVRPKELERIGNVIEKNRMISGGLENPELPYEPKGLARAAEIKIAPMTPDEKKVYFSHYLSRMAFDNDLECPSPVMRFFVNVAINRFPHKNSFFQVFSLMNQIIVATKKTGEKTISKSVIGETLKKLAPLHNRTKALADLDTRLKKKIFGQDEAIQACYENILSTLDDEAREKPTVLAFFGPSGVGKTALAEEISLALTGQKASIINMAEYADSFKSSILIGSAKGYVDSDKDGLLATIIKETPNAVIVLDEFEKAHQQVQQMFLGVFDKGSVFDNNAGQIDMTRATIILTSNAGVRNEQSIGFGCPKNPSYIADKKLIQDEFPPELLGRIDSQILFKPLSEETLGKIVDKFMGMIKPRFDKLGVRVTLTPESKQELIDKAKDPTAGARPLLSYIRQKIKTPVEIAVLKKKLKRGDSVVVESMADNRMRIIPRNKGRASQIQHTRV